MKVERFDESSRFWEIVESHLVHHEAENCLPIGICVSLRDARMHSSQFPYLAAVMREGQVQGAIVRTPPRLAVLSFGIAADALDAMVEDVASVYPDLPGVLGAQATADAFAAKWENLVGSKAMLFRSSRIHKALRVRPPSGVPGEARVVDESDRELLEIWLESFSKEVAEYSGPEGVSEIADVYLSGPPYLAVMWLAEGHPVSLAGLMGPTPNGARINAVYTPPEFRGRGYASAVTAWLTEYVLDQGRRFCFLFTDLANPTSNRIYQRIGYEPVCDQSHYRFDR